VGRHQIVLIADIAGLMAGRQRSYVAFLPIDLVPRIGFRQVIGWHRVIPGHNEGAGFFNRLC